MTKKVKKSETTPPDEIELVGNDSPEDTVDTESRIVLARQVLPGQLPLIPLHHRPLFPKMTVPMLIDDKTMTDLLLEASKAPAKAIGLVMRKDPESPSPEMPLSANELCGIGVAGEILQTAQPGGEGRGWGKGAANEVPGQSGDRRLAADHSWKKLRGVFAGRARRGPLERSRIRGERSEAGGKPRRLCR